MAKRIHVFALRNTSPEAVRAALAPMGDVESNAVNGWCWFSTSVWGIGADKILEPLDKLDGPLLFVTTEDACRWYLRLRAKGQEPYLTVHSFPPCPRDDKARDREDFDIFHEEYEAGLDGDSVAIAIGHPPIPESALSPLEFRDPYFEPYLDIDEDDWDDDDDGSGDDDDVENFPLANVRSAYAELGVPLSEALIARLAALPDDEVFGAFYELHAVEIVEALERFDIPHNRQAVLDTLTGRSVTPVEADWDVGNLPRFLAALGLGGEFDELVAGAEGEYREILAREPENYATPILKKMGKVTTVPLDGGPLKIPVEDGPLLFRAGYYTYERVEAAFTAALPTGGCFNPTARVPSYISVHEQEGQLEIGVLTNDVFLVPTSCRKLGKSLADLPTGTVLTLHLDGPKALRQQFRGPIAGGQWTIESATVALSAHALRDALELFRAGLVKVPLLAHDEGEVAAILAAVESDYTLHDISIGRDGLALSAPRRYCNALATLFFRHRFGQFWDCSRAIAENEENMTKWRGINEERAASERLPVTDTIVLKGRASIFYEADLTADFLDDGMKGEIEKVPALVEDQVGLGYLHLGNLVCGKIGGALICAFADRDRHAYAVHYIMPFGMTWKDCFSSCADGTSLTTTNGSMSEGSIPQLRILEHQSDAQDFSGLLTDHQKGREILQAQGIETIPIVPTLAGLARAIDDFLVKRLDDE